MSEIKVLPMKQLKTRMRGQMVRVPRDLDINIVQIKTILDILVRVEPVSIRTRPKAIVVEFPENATEYDVKKFARLCELLAAI